MRPIIIGRVWKLGDDIDTDVIIPTEYLGLETAAEMAQYAFSPLRPELARLIRAGAVIVGGKNFGCGSSREQAAEVLLALGIACVVARSFGRIFYRNAFNNGLLLIESASLADVCEEGDTIKIDLASHTLHSRDQVLSFSPIPSQLEAIVATGGLVPYQRSLNDGP